MIIKYTTNDNRILILDCYFFGLNISRNEKESTKMIDACNLLNKKIMASRNISLGISFKGSLFARVLMIDILDSNTGS